MEYSEFFQRIRLPGNPHAHPDSVVVRGNTRFTVLTERLLRLEWSPAGEFTDFATLAFPNRSVDQPPSFATWEDGENLWIETSSLTLTYKLQSGAFTPENLAIKFRIGAETRTWRPGQQASGNLGGTRRTLDLTGGDAPLEPGLMSRDGWSVFDDSSGVVLQPDDGWVGARPLQSEQDWYFFGYGHAYTDALTDYMRFGGAVPLIPRYVLGIWWSRFWPYSAANLEQLVADFADRTLPLDVLVIDMDWHLPGHWTGYTWNYDLFPDPPSFLKRMHEQGLHVTLNLHPADGIHPHEAAYEEMALALGMSDSKRTPIPFRITDRQFSELYFTSLHHPLEDQGIDFWWIDWQQGESSEISGLDPLLWLNHLHFADARRRSQRPLVFSRWGGLGNHRYPIGFSGDTFGGWATLAAMPHFTATAANVGFGWWSHDIGGHFGTVDPEIFTRWIQFGALSPCLRLHAAKHPLAERRPWAFPQALNAIRRAFDLRYELVPYLYTMARHTHERGVSVCRPMYYAYPEHESAYYAYGQYQLGDDLLAAPITDPAESETGLATKDVWIPPGNWYRFDTGAAWVGPRWIRISGDLETIPLFARAGAIVPAAAHAPHLVDVPNDWLDIRVFPGGDGTFRLYEDDGLSPAYQGGAYEWTSLSYVSKEPTRGELRIDAALGHCAALPVNRGYTVTFVGVAAPERVEGDEGKSLSWSFDEKARRVQVTLPSRPRHTARVVAVQWSAVAGEVEPHEPSGGGGVETPPFMHVTAYTTSDEAKRQLARLVLVPPYSSAGQPGTCDAEVLWRDAHHSSVAEHRQLVSNLEREMILTAPWTLDPTLQPHHWEVQAHFSTGGDHFTSIYRGPCINPPLQGWNLRYAGQERWSLHEADTADRLTITEPFEVKLDPSVASAAEAEASVDMAQSTPVWFDTWTNGRLSLEIDGKLLGISVPQPMLAGLAHPWPVSRFGPVTLPSGKHSIRVGLAAPAEPEWVFGVLLVDDTGTPIHGCTYGVGERETAG